MFKLIAAELDQVVYFDSAKVNFTKSPITFIRGLNCDSDPASPSSNGAGKTLLMSIIPNVLFFSTPLALKKKARKDILGKGSSIALTFRAEDGAKYKVVQAPTKYIIFKDGEDQEVKKIPVAEQMIRDLFPMSEVLFYSTCYVSTQRPFPFQQDSDSDRLSHLVDMFRLDQYDRIRDYFAQKLREVKDDEIKLSMLEQRLSAVKIKLRTAKKAVAKKDVSALKAKAKKLEAQVHEIEKRKHDLNVVLVALKTLLSVEKELDALRSEYKYKEAPDTTFSWLKKQRAQVRAYESYLTLKEQYEESRASVLSDLKSLVLPENSAEECSKLRERLTKRVEDLSLRLSEQETLRREHDKIVRDGKALATSLSELGVDVKTDTVDLEEDIESQLSVYRTTLRLEKLLKSHDHEDDLTCPTCLSDVDVAKTRQAVKAAKKTIPALEQRAQAQEQYAKYLELKDKLKKLKFDPKAHGALKSELDEVNGQLTQVKADQDTLRTYASYKRTLESLKRPKKVEAPDTDLNSKQIDAEMDLCTDILKHLEAKAKLTQAHPEIKTYKRPQAINSMLESTKEDLAKLDTEVLAVRKTLGDVTASVEDHAAAVRELDTYTEEFNTVTATIEKLRPNVQKKRLIEVLLKAYGAKGLRTIAANEICGLIQTNMNHYRGLVFSEPFEFSVTANETGLSIIVDRGNNKISDVRTLSGAESNFFRMLFVLSVLPLLPSDRRTNFLVLDEPTSHTDEASRAIFREQFLPAIQQVVPHTFVITPHADDYVPGSKEWLVKKQNGVSEVITI